MTSYDELIARLPDNTLGVIGADDVRAIVEQLTPAYYFFNVPTPATFTLPPGVWTDVPIGAPDFASSDWADDHPEYLGPIDRVATIAFWGQETQSAPNSEYQLTITRAGSTIPLLTRSDPSAWTLAELRTGDVIAARLRQSSGASKDVIINWRQFAVIAQLQGPLLVEGV